MGGLLRAAPHKPHLVTVVIDEQHIGKLAESRLELERGRQMLADGQPQPVLPRHHELQRDRGDEYLDPVFE